MIKEQMMLKRAAERRKKLMQKMRERGKSDQEIAAAHGISRQRVHKILGPRK